MSKNVIRLYGICKGIFFPIRHCLFDFTLAFDISPFHKKLKKINALTYSCASDPITGKYGLVMKFADGGTLRDYLPIHFPRLSWSEKVRLAIDIASGLEFIHSSKIVH